MGIWWPAIIFSYPALPQLLMSRNGLILSKSFPICRTIDSGRLVDIMTDRCVVKGKTAQKGSIELNLEIRLKEDNTDFINVLSEMPGVASAVLMSFNGVYGGLFFLGIFLGVVFLS